MLLVLTGIDGFGTRTRVELPREVVDDDMIDDVGNQHMNTDEFRCLRQSIRNDGC